jgi:hypothetical protein
MRAGNILSEDRFLSGLFLSSDTLLQTGRKTTEAHKCVDSERNLRFTFSDINPRCDLLVARNQPSHSKLKIILSRLLLL